MQEATATDLPFQLKQLSSMELKIRLGSINCNASVAPQR